ncbi:MAG: NERD domain-containing protein [Anaerolineae bacterium]|nr:NERD domain-containing protein [Anaerolineae bacterium]
MQNLNPSSSMTRRRRYYLSMGCLVFFGGAIAIALGVLFSYVPLWDNAAFDLFTYFLLVAGVLVVILGGFIIARSQTLQEENQIAYAVGEGLGQFLDARYTYLRNVSRRGVGYIDAVLVGPPGALVFRIVDYSGYWFNERGNWRVDKNGKLRTADTNPTKECAKDVYALRKYLAKRGFANVPVYGIVVFSSPNIKLKADGPAIPIAEIPTLYQIMRRDYLTDERITQPTVKKAVEVLLDG